jgi:hypothetical protein
VTKIFQGCSPWPSKPVRKRAKLLIDALTP